MGVICQDFNMHFTNSQRCWTSFNTLTDLYPKKSKEEDVNLEDREAEKIANAILELRGKNGT